MQAPAEAAEKENVDPEDSDKQPRPVGRSRGSGKVLSPQQVREAKAASARWAKRDRHEDRVRAVLHAQTSSFVLDGPDGLGRPRWSYRQHRQATAVSA